jgi:hypothetical protein
MIDARCGSPRLRVIVGIFALVLTSILVVRVAAAAGQAARLVALVGLIALVVQALAVTRWPAAAGAAAAMLGGLAAASLLPATNRGSAVEMAVLFLAATETGSWAGRLRSVVPETAASVRRQLGEIGAVVAGGGLASTAILGAAHVNGPDGRIALVIGLVAAVVPVALLAARRTRLGSEQR